MNDSQSFLGSTNPELKLGDTDNTTQTPVLYVSMRVGVGCWFCVLLAQLGVDGKHFRVTDEGESQDGDGVGRLHTQQQQQQW